MVQGSRQQVVSSKDFRIRLWWDARRQRVSYCQHAEPHSRCAAKGNPPATCQGGCRAATSEPQHGGELAPHHPAFHSIPRRPPSQGDGRGGDRRPTCGPPSRAPHRPWTCRGAGRAGTARRGTLARRFPAVRCRAPAAGRSPPPRERYRLRAL